MASKTSSFRGYKAQPSSPIGDEWFVLFVPVDGTGIKVNGLPSIYIPADNYEHARITADAFNGGK